MSVSGMEIDWDQLIITGDGMLSIVQVYTLTSLSLFDSIIEVLSAELHYVVSLM